jgi:hypothetical protein
VADKIDSYSPPHAAWAQPVPDRDAEPDADSVGLLFSKASCPHLDSRASDHIDLIGSVSYTVLFTNFL